ncbi:type VII secretion-associated serine protease mycosin [Nocardia sp. alder85J]|uniref:type VII secretion-associated serine protease mycosin n=1 Tax=Nocardia sp. alder85J TaxID=2862949 RepID=UPI001CD3C646|nr:type VII secretion-associated serine protease mycosin [Nocardia sp. alder85J]MCX4096244.1 type VII secretion-associated serine protease mycosin [Nocardia sp. alder85J]
MIGGVSVGGGGALADRPPPVVPGLLPPGPPVGPPEDTEQPANAPCVSTVPGGDGPAVPTAQRALNLDRAWQFSRGGGQLVAVVDTGVARHPRLPGLIGGGDYVAHSDGTEDCDGHGTAVAGIIAATQVAGQGFAGVAPDATILSIRQSSEFFQAKGRSQQKNPEDLPDGYGNTHTMAWAIRRAADMGATVINVSETTCPTGPLHDEDLGAALQYAAIDKNAVVVVAAGNNDVCRGTNPVQDPVDPAADPWSKISMNVSPARYDQYTLSVGSVDVNGQPSKFTVPGPWVGVAAPGENITSLDVNFADPNSRGTAVGFAKRGQQSAISGTSFATPYVAGVAALVRARFPQLSALEVIQRIEATAHAPAEGWNPYQGYGTVDPVAALTDEVPNSLPAKRPDAAQSWQLPVPRTPGAADDEARNVALIGTGVIVVLLVLGYLASFPLRRRFGVRED